MSTATAFSTARMPDGTIVSADAAVPSIASADGGAHNPIAPVAVEDRRSEHRFQTAFRPACVVANGRIALGILRNMSQGGVMIELDVTLEQGDRVAYFWDEQQLVEATVVRVDGNHYGLSNVTGQCVSVNDNAYRSVRVPCAVEADIWVHGEHHRARIANLSLGGMRLVGIDAWKGAPLTIRFAGVELCNACAVWSHDGEIGIRFENRLTRAQLSAILSHESVRFDEVLFE